MKKFILKYTKVSSFSVGGLSVLALPPYFILPILFFSFSIFFYILNNCKNYKKAFISGYWFGFGFFSFGLAWVGNALLVDWQTFGLIYPLVPLAAGAFFGLFTAFPAFLSYFFINTYGRYLALAAFMVIFEWIRSFFLTGFPWNLMGYIWCYSNITIQSASIFGTYGLSLTAWMIFTSPALFIIKRNKKSLIFVLLTIFIITGFLYGFGYYRLKNQESISEYVNIRLVQPAIPQSLKWKKEYLEQNFADYINLSKQLPLDNTDFVIWGETASPFALDADSKHLRQLLSAVPKNGHLITGMVRYNITPYERYLLYNSMVTIADNGSIDEIYDKSHLVPFGEYIPLREYLPGWIRPITENIGEFQAGEGPKTMKIGNLPSFGGLICYEVIFPTKVVDKKNRPSWLINITNDGWYGKSAGPYQHLETSRLRAVEEGIPLVRSANSGISAAIDAYGVIINKISLHERGILDIKLPIQQNLSTTYGKLGNVLPLLLCLINIMLAFYLNKDKLQNS